MANEGDPAEPVPAPAPAPEAEPPPKEAPVGEPSPSAPSPRDEAIAMLRAGKDADTIWDAMRAKGLDEADAVLVLQSAYRALGREDEVAEMSTVELLSRSQPDLPAVGDRPKAPPKPTVDGACSRCGAFATADVPLVVLLGKPYCATCAARPDVNYLQALRDERWGKRDGWAWWHGFLAFVASLSAVMILTWEPINALLPALCAALYWVAFLGHPSGRLTAVAASLLLMLPALRSGGPVTGTLLLVLGSILALWSTTSKLFYRVEPTQEELEGLWRELRDNRPAVWGRGLGMVAVAALGMIPALPKAALVPLGFGVVAIAASVRGLQRVDPSAHPPVGRRGSAILGLVLGSLAVVGVGLAFARHAAALPF